MDVVPNITLVSAARRNISRRTAMSEHHLPLNSPEDVLQQENPRTTSTSPLTLPTTQRRRTMSSSTSSSASASPTLEARHLSPISTSATPYPRPRKVSSQSCMPEAIPEDDVPEFKLQTSANEQDPLHIKANLTELLNCEQVRNDPKMRQYVQSRLFESELELKRQRRRRVSLPTPALESAVDDSPRQ